MAAFGAAVAMGAQEIEFDLWETADGEIVSIHDANLDRVSTGHGFVWD
ncbi:MAG: glycerophosphodiester phosphodiesterase, partial [Clostridia bacterium]|nr:glycerophosphodiester phosphodiesterase [Clostridia bacterium]